MKQHSMHYSTLVLYMQKNTKKVW